MKLSSEEAIARGYGADEVLRIKIWERGNREARRLIERIDAVFVNIPKPAVTLRVARAFDDEHIVSAERAEELALADPETDWRAVSKEKTETFQEYFTFADAPGWRFYLPAFMCHYLSEFPGYDRDAVYSACERKTHVEELTAPELELVDQFLRLCNRYEQHGWTARR